MGYIIGSFNTLKMSFQSNKESAKDFRKIASIIKQERFDVVALQEVMNEMVLKQKILPALGRDWDGRWLSPTPFTSASNEGYAFIWNTKRLRLIESGNSPGIYQRVGSGVGNGRLIRPPMIARFTPSGLPGGSNFELRLINTHIIFGKPSTLERTLSDYELRKEELRVLSETVYRLFSSKRYGDNMPAYTILMGDYNLCISGPGPKISSEIPISANRTLKTVQDQKTSVKVPSESSGADTETDDDFDVIDLTQSGDYYSRNYDHFSYEVTLEEKLGLHSSRVDALGKYYGNDLESYRREISDHVPIKLILNLKNRGN